MRVGTWYVEGDLPQETEGLRVVSAPDAAVMNSLWITLIVEGYLLTLLLVPFVILQRRRQSVATVAWIMAIVVLPYAGSILFLLFGINRVERRAALKQIGRAHV